uniref:Guanine nucleotide-binding protein-like 3 n=1 Tax=Pogona vitticeps TaxID=103695 RepID=A0ABM5FKD3_9SAUR
MATGPIISWQIEGEEIEVVTDSTFLGSMITADGDSSHEIKRRLLGRKAMINLDSILKSRHITLPAKVSIVKAMVFPVVMYGSESWTIKKADRQRIDSFEFCWRRLLRVPWTAKKTNLSILKGINPECSLEGQILKLRLQYFDHLMRREDPVENTLMLGKSEGKRRRGRQRTRWLVREHHRKLRKEAKKRGHKKPKRDLGIPNSAPFKEEVLREAEQRKQRLEELKQKQKLDRQKELEKKRNKKNKDANEAKPHEKKSANKQEPKSKQNVQKNSKKSFCQELRKVIEASDVVLEVLDARDPLGCRCPQVEQLVNHSEGGKKLLLILNKIDLIPKENLEKWLNYLNNEFPTVAFKSSMQLKDKTVQEKKNTKRRSAYIELSRASLCFGSECLLKLLREHSLTKDKALQVGVVGFPNVGKSSIINSLKEVRACNVGPVRGLTRCIQTVHIDKHIKMLDSPCVVAAPSSSALALALRSPTDFEAENATESVDAILKHCSKQQIMLHYNIPDYRTSLEFLTLLAQKRGMLKKGGLPDTEGAAKLFLYDWTGARISYYSRPPATWNLSSHLSNEIVAAAKVGFNFQELEEDNKSTMKALKYPNQPSSIVFQSPGFTDGVIEDKELPEEVVEKEDMETSEDEEDLTEDEDDEIESDIEDVEEENSKILSNKIASKEPKNANSGVIPTGKQHDLDEPRDLDDAYDFNTDYM